MLSIELFEQLAAEVATLNAISLEEAERIVALIGDTPEIDEFGNVIVDGRHVKLPPDD